MSQLADTVVFFPVSGSKGGGLAGIPPGIYMRDAQQCVSGTMYVFMHPGGWMTSSVQLAPTNPNRARMTFWNSGSLNLLIEHGTQTFNPNIGVSPTNMYDNLLPPVPASIVPPYVESAPVYTGPIQVGWSASGSLSGSAVVMVDYSYG